MIRLYRQQAQRVMVGLMYLRRLGYDFRQAFEYYGNQSAPKDPVLATALRSALQDRETTQMGTIENFIGELAPAINADGKFQQADSTLVDLIVEICQLPYARANLSPRTMQELRRALLLPDELAGLNDRLRRREASCMSCGHAFQMGEAATVLTGPDGIILECMRCRLPMSVPCYASGDCDRNVPFGTAYTANATPNCGQHTATPAQPSPPARRSTIFDNLAAQLNSPVTLREMEPLPPLSPWDEPDSLDELLGPDEEGDDE
jgi:predicted RNA-binding Zn-ribbon protein involved in translation (DUF1610 family)